MLKGSHLILFLGAALFLAACGRQQDSWAGLTQAENGDIFVSYETSVAKLDRNGNIVWKYPAEANRGERFFAGAAFTDDQVYVGDYTGGVHALDRETGEQVWEYSEGEPTSIFGFIKFGGSTDRVIAPVTIGNGHLYVPDEHGIFILDRETGARVDRNGNPSEDALLLETERAVWAEPYFMEATDEHPERLYVAALDHHFYALNLETGDLLWQTDLEGASPSKPTYDATNNLFYLGTFAGEVVAVDAETGEIQARFEADGWVWDAPLLLDDMLYFSDLEGNVYAMAYDDGQFRETWKKTVAESKIRPRPLPVGGDLLVVIAKDGDIFGLERATGNEIWHETLEDHLLSPLLIIENAAVEPEEGDPATAETLVVTATNNRDRLIIGLRADNGNMRWEIEYKD